MPSNLVEPLECAFLFGDTADRGWWARVTFKCPVCGRRNSKAVNGPGKMADALPLTVICKNKHETLVIPYRWNEENKVEASDQSVSIESL